MRRSCFLHPFFLFLVLGGFTIPCSAIANEGETDAPKGWPSEVKAIRYPASVDDSMQPMLIYRASSKEKRPLLVALHTWSNDYKQAGGQTLFARWAMEYDWHFIHPHFRGPNRTPEACGSEKVVQDISDAVAYAQERWSVDENRIYLIGSSGGGHASLLMAGRRPDLWAGVSAWVPISDIRAWWEQKSVQDSRYARDIENAIGGRPDENATAAEECVKRSPLSYLEQARGVNLDINAGVQDGRKGSVPFTHSLHAFNAVVPEGDKVNLEFITRFYETMSPPVGRSEPGLDPLFGRKEVMFRKVSGNTRVTIFQGGHEILPRPGLNWLAQQRKGQAAEWQVVESDQLDIWKKDTQSGK